MGLFSDDPEDNERFKNLLLFKVYATDEEIEEMAPAILIGVLIVLAVIGAVAYFS
jgi:hypothetical protein